MEQATRTTEDTEILARLRAEHRELDDRIKELEGRLGVSVAEENEIRRLKKMKLRKKDIIHQLMRRTATA